MTNKQPLPNKLNEPVIESIGSVALGVAVGTAIGGIVGALAQRDQDLKAHTITIHTTDEEEAYWRDNHKHRVYFDSLSDYDNYAPAYRFGIEAYSTYIGRKYSEIEAQLAHLWEGARGTSRLTWETAKHATRDAYERLSFRGQ